MNIDLTKLFQPRENGLNTVIVMGLTRRHISPTPFIQILLDQHESASCIFLRAESPSLRVFLDGGYKIVSSLSGGWLLRSITNTLPAFWIPRAPMRRKLDAQGHILFEARADIEGIEAAPNSLTFTIDQGKGSLDVVIWRLDDPDLVLELASLNPLEQQAWYLWGSHTVYRRPADLYLHLIHGHVYENRTSWPHYWKICSENDAHALYVTLTGLMRATGKRIYGLLRTQLALSVIDRLGEDGAFRHGEWSKDMEAHYRLHASGMHLMMDHLAEHNDPTVAAALARATDFLAKRPDHTKLGAWFLHDDLELNPESMKKSPFTWKASQSLGKSPSNMLVLNTHLDTLVCLDRARGFSNEHSHADLIKSAALAVGKVLQLRPAETLYKVVYGIIYLTFLPSAKAASLPIHMRALKRIGWKWLAPRLHHLKTALPRLAMPGGYIDRAASIKGVSDAYQSINVMDLLRFLRRFPDEYVDKVTHEALAFTHSSGILEHWRESPKKEYALGFWAEALWHACSLYPDNNYRIWLADAMLALETMGMGLPPSLLGTNAEAIPPSDQHPCPIPAHTGLRIANLSRGDKYEILVVNATDSAIEMDWTKPPGKPVQWKDATGEKITVDLNIPARSWLHGQTG